MALRVREIMVVLSCSQDHELTRDRTPQSRKLTCNWATVVVRSTDTNAKPVSE